MPRIRSGSGTIANINKNMKKNNYNIYIVS